MKTYLARYWAVYGISLVAPSLVACGDSGVGTTEGDSETQGTSGETTASTMTPTSTSLPTSTTDMTSMGPSSESMSGTSSTTDPDPTTGGSTSDATTGPVTGTSTGGDDSTTGSPLMCDTFLCGDPAVCCLVDEECLNGACETICPSGVRCGDNQEMCCAEGDVCVGDTCTTPGAACIDSYDCDPGEYCETVLGNCLPQPDPLQCEVIPNFDSVDVQLEWSHTADEIIAVPAIADVDGDGSPDLVVNTARQDGNPNNYQIGEIILLDGVTGALKWRIPNNPNNQQFGATGRATLAVGDVNGDSVPDIVYAGRPDNQVKSAVHAVDGDGNLIWTGRLPNNTTARIRISNGAATMVNLDNDPQAEIAFGGAIFDHDGLLVSNLIVNTYDASTLGSPHGQGNPTQLLYSGGISTFADVSGDGYPELITGNRAFNIMWANPNNVTLQQRWFNQSGKGGDGFPAVADLDLDGDPEVVLVAWPEIKVLNGSTGQLWCGVDPTDAMCVQNPTLRTPPLEVLTNLGGPPTIADFDGDMRPEIGIATGTEYVVFDLNRPGETIVKPMMDPMPAAGAIYPRWKVKVQDNTSGTTGSSVFDFQGDGKAEVLYEDECYVRVYDGETGAEKLKITNSNSTIHEYPLVVDVDDDGNSEFIVVANLSDDGMNSPNAKCLAADPGYKTRKGIYVYGAGGDNWVPTRGVWTMHGYHVTNVDSSGNPPMMEQDNWTTPGLNNFRQNSQGAGVFNAADLTASLAIGLEKCAAQLVLKATIYNQGALGVPLGIDVSFYYGTDNTGMKITTVQTTEAILTGGSTVVTFAVDAPPEGETLDFYVEVDPGPNGGQIPECNEENGAVVTDAQCPAPG